ncbi:MAG: hypothetical protein FWD59_08740 [Micrococcales bacterium]|nr:hypothetical protein [Micrococcales bacterium]
MDSSIGPLFGTYSLATRRGALEHGATEWQLDNSGHLRVRHGVYVKPSLPRDFDTMVRSALAVSPPGTMATGLTALRLLRARLPQSTIGWTWRPSEPIELLVPSGQNRVRRPGVICHRTQRNLEPWRVVDRIPLAEPAHVWLTLASRFPLDDLVIVGDGLTRRNDPFCTAEDLQKALVNPGRVKGLPTARRAAQLIRPGTDTTDETRLRLAIVGAGFPCPEVDHVVWNPHTGRLLYRLDMAFLILMVGVEADGLYHAEVDVWEYDTKRENTLTQMGWDLVHATPKDVENPDRFLAALRVKVDRAQALRRIPS